MPHSVDCERLECMHHYGPQKGEKSDKNEQKGSENKE